MERTLLYWGCLAAFLVAATTAALAQDRRDYAAYYVEKYGEVAAEEDPRVKRAEEVFQRVMDAADKKANRFPELVVLRTWGDPWAVSLPDGSVVVTLGALRVCYEGVDEPAGDARAAFVFGHELAHLSKDDFWHRPAFDAVAKHVRGDAAAGELKEQLRETRDDVRTKELQADSFGIIYMAMAGYDPAAILPRTGASFLDHWAAEVRGLSKQDATSATHHTPQRRTEFLRARLERVIDHLDYFDLGVRYYQIGLYEEALEFLSEFRKEYPGREVFNNVGLTHYQLAVEALAACDPGAAFAFMPSVAIDATPAGPGSALRATWETPNAGGLCDSYRREFLSQLEDAIRNLRVAVDKDPFYLPARLNLSSALIMAGNHAEALAVVDAALASHPADPYAKNNKAVALHLFGEDNSLDVADQVLAMLTTNTRDPAAARTLLYNQASVLEGLGRTEQARQVWEQFLDGAENDLYAVTARRRAGLQLESTLSTYPVAVPRPPIPMGRLAEGSPNWPTQLESRAFTLGTLAGEILKGERMRVLVVDSRVELVEEELGEALDSSGFKGRHGPPQRILTGHNGETWVYKDYIADVNQGEIRRLVHF